jgi:hypothetical protein
MISGATTLTEITGPRICRRQVVLYHGRLVVFSIASTTTNFFLLQSGTGTNCADNTISVFPDFAPQAFAEADAGFPTPIKITAGHALSGAGTRNITVAGYIA